LLAYLKKHVPCLIYTLIISRYRQVLARYQIPIIELCKLAAFQRQSPKRKGTQQEEDGKEGAVDEMIDRSIQARN